VPHANEDGLPRVLLAGDSITRGYYDGVAKALSGQAYCARYSTSKFIGHDDFIAELTNLLDAYRFDVIHINNGLHGWDYTEEEYAASFPRLLEVLATHAKGARVVWASTTPVRTAPNPADFDSKTERVRARNRIAADVMQAHGIQVNDLFALVEQRADFYSQDGVHFSEAGRAAQAKQVTEIVSGVLRTLPIASPANAGAKN
jgi:lysophospholipase L1-like esterase